jgi:hypothetical protein
MRAKRPGANGNRGETTQGANGIRGETTQYHFDEDIQAKITMRTKSK